MARKYSEGENYKVIAFVLSCFSNDEQLLIMKKAAAACKEHHYKIVFFSTLTDFYYDDLTDAGEKKIFETISVEKFDAIVLMSESFKLDEDQTEMVRRANAAGVPVIAVDKYMEGCINLAFDYGDTFRDIVKHMVEYHGYRTINFMAGMPENSYSEERLQVFKEVLAANNIPFDARRVYYGYFWEKPTREAMDKMMADDLPMPEAIVCANDAMAITVCSYLQERGYRVPEDVAISGFDAITMEQYNRPRLTTGVLNIEEFIRVLFEIIDEGAPEKYREKVIPIYNKMQIGQSCGCSDLETARASSEMVRLKTELYRLLKFQSDVNQLVANFGNSEQFEDAIRAVPAFMENLMYKDFWFCANEDLVEDVSIQWENTGAEETWANQHYTKKLQVYHYHSGAEVSGADLNGTVEFGELIPDRRKQFEENDYLMVLTMHMRGNTCGYAVASFDIEQFWVTAYSAFITSFRQLLELQKSQMQLMRVYMLDLLTGLYNRNGFYQKIERLLEIAEDMDMTIISMDMDGLKMINDTYGHAEGDEALQNIGKIIKRSIKHEIAARIGGDEFLIAFAGNDIDDRTDEIVAQIKEGISCYNQSSNKEYELHASIGSYINRVRNHSLDHFLKKADDLMYARKYLHKKEKGTIR